MSVGPDGTDATLIETRAGASRMRMVPLAAGRPAHGDRIGGGHVRSPAPAAPRADALPRGRPGGWLVNQDGRQNRQLKLTAGRIAAALWAPDGRTLLYLVYPENRAQLHAIREHSPDTGADKLIAKTSQFASFSGQSRYFGLRRRKPEQGLAARAPAAARDRLRENPVRAPGHGCGGGMPDFLPRQPAAVLPERPQRQPGHLLDAARPTGGEDRGGFDGEVAPAACAASRPPRACGPREPMKTGQGASPSRRAAPARNREGGTRSGSRAARPGIFNGAPHPYREARSLGVER